MSTREFANAIRQGRQRLEAEAPGAFAGAALTALATIKDRSIENGIFVNSRPNDTVDYSSNLILTSRFLGKERNQAGRKYIASNRLGNWKGFRQAQGLPSDNVNASYTNELWRSMGVLKLQREGRRVSVTVSTGDSAQEEKLSYLVDRYGVFYNPTPPEQRKMLEDTVNELIKIALPWLR